MSVETRKAQRKADTDRIEKRVDLRASPSRVWRAIANAQEFGQWFRMEIDGEFVEGAAVRGRITHPGYEHVTVEMWVERIQPERYFSYRWHPYAIDTRVDYSGEPTTLVEFILEATEGGTAVTIIESGFDRLPPGRRDEAFRMNEGGWVGQTKNLEEHLT